MYSFLLVKIIDRIQLKLFGIHSFHSMHLLIYNKKYEKKYEKKRIKTGKKKKRRNTKFKKNHNY